MDDCQAAARTLSQVGAGCNHCVPPPAALDVGDYIVLPPEETWYRVKKFGLMDTILLKDNGDIVHVPNPKLWRCAGVSCCACLLQAGCLRGSPPCLPLRPRVCP